MKHLLGKVQALAACPPPTTKRQVRQFLGIANYYQRFIPLFVSIASPLTGILTKNSPQCVLWTQECEDAFRTLKECLCLEPVLCSLDFNRDFFLHMDTSEVGLGAVLSQEIDGEDHPVLCLSWKLFPLEKNYSVIEKEALTVKWACDALRYYLLGAQFTLVTNHAPLQWLTRMKNNDTTLLCWYLMLQPYAFTIWQRAGKDHVNADFLSRLGGMEELGPDKREPDLSGGCKCSEAVWFPATPERDELRRAFLQDPSVNFFFAPLYSGLMGGGQLYQGPKLRVPPQYLKWLCK